MAGLLDAVDGAVRDAFCIVGSTLEGLAGLDAAIGPGGAPDAAEAYERLRGFRRMYCDDAGEEPPPPPFPGGQCPVAYQINLVNGGSGPPTTVTFGTGPVTGTRVEGPNQFGGYVWSVTGPSGDIATFRNTADAGERWSIASVSRLDAQPDNCGSLPPTFPPPSIPPVTVDIEVSPTIFAPFTFVFAPIQIDVDGRITIPVNISGTADIDININGKLELAPKFEFELDPSDWYPEPGNEPDDPGGSGDGESGDDDEPPEPGRRIYAVVIRGRILPDARPSGIYQDKGPDIYVPRLGSVRFGVPIDGTWFWSEDIDVKGLNSVVQCPIPWGASRVVVNAAHGVALTYKPVKSEPKSWPALLQLGAQETSDNR